MRGGREESIESLVFSSCCVRLCWVFPNYLPKESYCCQTESEEGERERETTQGIGREERQNVGGSRKTVSHGENEQGKRNKEAASASLCSVDCHFTFGKQEKLFHLRYKDFKNAWSRRCPKLFHLIGLWHGREISVSSYCTALYDSATQVCVIRAVRWAFICSERSYFTATAGFTSYKLPVKDPFRAFRLHLVTWDSTKYSITRISEGKNTEGIM